MGGVHSSWVLCGLVGLDFSSVCSRTNSKQVITRTSGAGRFQAVLSGKWTRTMIRPLASLLETTPRGPNRVRFWSRPRCASHLTDVEDSLQQLLGGHAPRDDLQRNAAVPDEEAGGDADHRIFSGALRTTAGEGGGGVEAAGISNLQPGRKDTDLGELHTRLAVEEKEVTEEVSRRQGVMGGLGVWTESYLLAGTLMATQQLLAASDTCSSSQLDISCADCSSSPEERGEPVRRRTRTRTSL